MRFDFYLSIVCMFVCACVKCMCVFCLCRSQCFAFGVVKKKSEFKMYADKIISLYLSLKYILSLLLLLLLLFMPLVYSLCQNKMHPFIFNSSHTTIVINVSRQCKFSSIMSLIQQLNKTNSKRKVPNQFELNSQSLI